MSLLIKVFFTVNAFSFFTPKLVSLDYLFPESGPDCWETLHKACICVQLGDNHFSSNHLLIFWQTLWWESTVFFCVGMCFCRWLTVKMWYLAYLWLFILRHSLHFCQAFNHFGHKYSLLWVLIFIPIPLHSFCCLKSFVNDLDVHYAHLKTKN